MGERLLCKQEVVGSIPSGSTNLRGETPLRLAEPDFKPRRKGSFVRISIRALAISSRRARCLTS